MKTKLTLCSLLFFFLFSSAANACPVIYRGLINVVDEKNNPIKGAEVWKFYCETDSYRLSRNKHYINDVAVTDSSQFVYKTSGGGGWGIDEDPCKPSEIMFRITAPGYPDLVLKNVSFKSVSRVRGNLPELTVTMYHSRYVKKGEQFIRLENYACNKNVEVKDSLTLVFRDYVHELYAESTVEEAERVHSAGIKTFPNPVKDVLKLEISSDIFQPHRGVITDIHGKTIQEFEINEAATSLDLSWEGAGLYFISVFNTEGELQYCVRFVKA